MKKKYTNLATAMAAVSTGASLEEENPGAVAAAEVQAAVANEEDKGGATAENPEAPGAEPEAVAAEPAAEPAPAPASTEAPSGVVTLLKEQLSEAQTGMINAKAEMTALQKKFDELVASIDPLKGIVAQAINNMLVPLNSPAEPKLSALAPAELVARHQAVAESFGTWYKSGGVSSAHADTDAMEEVVEVSSLERARLHLVRPAQNNNK